MKKFTALLLLTVLFTTIAQAQDRIIRINPSDTILCRITEIGDELVRYTTSEYTKDLPFTIDKNFVRKIIFENGREMTFSNALKDMASYENQRKNALKVSFFSPMMGATIFSYERSITPGQSIEFGLGIIGLGIDDGNRDSRGIVLKAGYKFMTSPTWYDRKLRYAHILKGAYFKPELTMASYRDTYTEFYHDNKQNTTTFSLIIVGGKQWVFADRVTLDLFGGIGYGFGNGNHNQWHYGFLATDSSPNIAFTGGLKIGVLF